MHDIPLNDTQRIFADKNHNLVYKFLHEKNLPASEYYDIVIFGYLRAVQRYLTDPNLAGYSFVLGAFPKHCSSAGKVQQWTAKSAFDSA